MGLCGGGLGEEVVRISGGGCGGVCVSRERREVWVVWWWWVVSVGREGVWMCGAVGLVGCFINFSRFILNCSSLSINFTDFDRNGISDGKKTFTTTSVWTRIVMRYSHL